MYARRVADDGDPLRDLIRASLRAHIPPTIFTRERTKESPWWTDRDTQMVMALEYYEAGLCPGGPHVLAETSKPEHAGAYRPAGEEDQIVCHRCKAQALLSDHMAEKEGTAGLFVPLVLDEEIVARNKLPVPPRPPELVQQPEVDVP